MTLPPGVELFSDVPYARYGERALTMHVFRPQKRAAPAPAVLYVHGGGWKLGDKDGTMRLASRMAQRGYVCATISYRLSGEAPFPAQIHDVCCAGRFLRAHAGELGLDPARIGAWGHSAGGHLVTLLGVAGGRPEFAGTGGWPEFDSQVQAVCNCCGVNDVALWSPGGQESDTTKPDHYAALLLGGPTPTKLELARVASPVTYVSRSAPPILTVHGVVDEVVPIEQGRLLHRALTAAGAHDHQLHELPGAGHGFGGPEVDAIIDTFFDRVLRVQR